MSDKRDLIVCDVETTGLSIARHWPLEVAAINVTTGDELYFVPALPSGALDNASGNALRINRYFERGVYKQRLTKADSENRWRELWEWLAGNTLAGSNPKFDGDMLQVGYNWAVGEQDSAPWHHRLADLSAYAAGVIGIEPTALPGLDVVCRSLQVENSAPHTAMGDARATAECFRKLADYGQKAQS